MPNKRKIMFFVLFCAINLAVTGVLRTDAFYAMLSVVSPFDESRGGYNFGLLALCITVSIIFICALIQEITEQFSVGNYLLTRTTRNQGYRYLLKRSIRNTITVFFCKMIADVVFSHMDGIKNVTNAIVAAISTLLTLFIWNFVIYLLFQMHMKEKWVYFIMVLGVILMQYTSAYLPFCSVFVFGSPAIFETPMLWICVKAVCAALLLEINFKTYNKYEHLGMVEDL